jgi:hypothetical protein
VDAGAPDREPDPGRRDKPPGTPAPSPPPAPARVDKAALIREVAEVGQGIGWEA